jgi:imidazolonepropionase-like amidohydrolase
VARTARALGILKRALVALVALSVALISLFTLGVLWPSERLDPVRTTQPVAITHVTVVDVEGARLLADQTVVVEGGRIAAAGHAASVQVPAAARIVDGKGRYLAPALWDMHTHVYAFAPLLDLPLYIAHGVTNVRDMQGCPVPGDPFIACAEDKRRWTREALAGQRIAPRVVSTTSFMANGPGMHERIAGSPAFFDTATPEQARAFVRYFAGKVDAIKVYDRIPRAAYFALVEEARRLRIDVVGHRPHAVSAIEAAANQKSIEHARFILHESFSGSAALRARAGQSSWREDRRRMLDEHEPALAEAIFAAMKREGTWYVPTHLTRWVDAYADTPAVREDPLLRYLHPLLRWQWLEDVDATLAEDPSPEGREMHRAFYRKGLELTAAAHRAGVKILVGTDYIVAGADVHRELEQLVSAGLTPAQALRAATVSAAQYAGLERRFGSVTIGKAADLILLDADPLADIRNTKRLAAVLFQGNLYERSDLDRISAHVQRAARSGSVACKILWRFIRQPTSY